jgi:hypothetical protein
VSEIVNAFPAKTVAGASNVAVGGTFAIVTCAVSVAEAEPSETRTPTVRVAGPSIVAAENVTVWPAVS